MMSLSAREISNEMSRHVQGGGGSTPDGDYLLELVDLFMRAPANTTEDAMAFIVWAAGFLKDALASMPNAEPDDPSNPKYLIAVSMVLATRATEALEKVTGIEAATIEGDVRRRN